MNVHKEIIRIRQSNGLTQEVLSEKLGVSRQAVAKWENGTSIPELEKLILISQLFNITLDSLIKGEPDCSITIKNPQVDLLNLKEFLCRAKIKTYAGKGSEVESSRMKSHDFKYREGDLIYLDSYFGSERFIGEEALWIAGDPIWSMNYMGRVLSDSFSGDFLKDSLCHVPVDFPYRGPMLYTKNDYTYHSAVDGEFNWFNGFEEIFYKSIKVYECTFHGGKIK